MKWSWIEIPKRRVVLQVEQGVGAEGDVADDGGDASRLQAQLGEIAGNDAVAPIEQCRCYRGGRRVELDPEPGEASWRGLEKDAAPTARFERPRRNSTPRFPTARQIASTRRGSV